MRQTQGGKREWFPKRTQSAVAHWTPERGSGAPVGARATKSPDPKSSSPNPEPGI